MIVRIISALLILFSANAAAQDYELEGTYLYKVTTVRAAPGQLSALLDWVASMKSSSFFDEAGERPPFVMRHSQGDQWDLLKITPMESWSAYHSQRASRRRAKIYEKFKEELAQGAGLLAFSEDHFAYGPPLGDIKKAFDGNNFFHIEMFEAAPGKAGELYQQRQFENSYLTLTGQTPNTIFKRAAGSDVDVFTIGFHENLQSFAAAAPVTAEEAEAAAIAAGFKNRADISFYLRSLISGHHDTLAVKVE